MVVMNNVLQSGVSELTGRVQWWILAVRWMGREGWK
jgi:hypothetical protein